MCIILWVTDMSHNMWLIGFSVVVSRFSLKKISNFLSCFQIKNQIDTGLRVAAKNLHINHVINWPI